MSVHERIDIDHKGTDKVTGVEWCIGEALVHGRDCIFSLWVLRRSWGSKVYFLKSAMPLEQTHDFYGQM